METMRRLLYYTVQHPPVRWAAITARAAQVHADDVARVLFHVRFKGEPLALPCEEKVQFSATSSRRPLRCGTRAFKPARRATWPLRRRVGNASREGRPPSISGDRDNAARDPGGSSRAPASLPPRQPHEKANFQAAQKRIHTAARIHAGCHFSGK